MTKFGYMRVSSKDQCEDRQKIALVQCGISGDNIYLDKQSGKDFDRPQYKKLMSVICENDTLVIKSIDRLGRNYNDILTQWRLITVEKKINIEVIEMPLLNTYRDRDLTGTLISDIVLQLLSYVAETERTFIKQRQKEGIAAAHDRGVRFGRKFKPIPPNYQEVLAAWEHGSLSENRAAKTLGIATHTFKKWRAFPCNELLRCREGWCEVG